LLRKPRKAWASIARASLVHTLILTIVFPSLGSPATVPLDESQLPPFSDETDARLPPATDASYELAAGDVDRDGDLDLFVANGGQSRLLVNDGGFFADETALRLPLLLGDTTFSADLGDVDGDGDLDLALANPSGVNRLLVNDGSGHFTDESAARLPNLFQVSLSVRLGDLDSDGDLDLVVANRGSQSRILINDGSGVFADETATRFAPGSELTYEIEIFDSDGDGALDLLVANQRSPNRLFVNNGLGYFADVSFRLPSPAAPSSAIDAAAVDVDGDGDLDLALAESEKGVRLLQNDGTGRFDDVSSAQLPAMDLFAIKVRAGDVDFDSDPDLVVAAAGPDPLLLNDGTGVFAASPPGVLPEDPLRSFGLALLDADSDLDLDLLFAKPRDRNRYLVNTIPYPRILLTASPPVIEVFDPVTFRVTAFDEDGIVTATLAITDPVGGIHTLDLMPDLAAGNALRVFTPNLVGAHEAVVTAVDSLGQTGTRRLELEVLPQDVTAPMVNIDIEGPVPLLVGHSVGIHVTTTDDRAVVTRTLTVQGTPVPLSSQGIATYVISTPGGHLVEATATDAAGNVGAATTSFAAGLDLEPPVVGVTATPSTVDLTQPVSIQVTATDNVAVVTRSLIVSGPGIAGDLPLALDGAGRATFTPFRPGTFTLVATATDPSALSGTATTSFEAQGVPDDTAPQVVLTIAPRTVPIGESVTLTVTATDDVGVTETTLEINGTPMTLDASGQLVFTPPALGTYTALATASDGAGNQASASETFRAVDPAGDDDPPVVEILTPAMDSDLTAPVSIVGTAQDETLVSYRLEYSPRGQNQYTTFAEGSSDVVNGVLGTFDTTLLLNDVYDVRLIAEDVNGSSASTQVAYSVKENLKVGNFTVTFQDLAIPVAGMPITVNRTYDSRNKSKGDFGVGWSLDLQTTRVTENRILGVGWAITVSGGPIPMQCLDPVGEHYVSVTLPNGRTEEFDMEVTPRCQLIFQFANVAFRARPGTTSTLQSLDGTDVLFSGGELFDFDLDLYDPSRYRLTAADGTVFDLDQAFGVRSVTDPNGNSVTFSANGILHSAGKSVTFERDASGRITKITDPNGNQLLYGYDSRGDLVSFTDANSNETGYLYNSSHGLLEIQDPRGITPIRNEYDDQGRLIAHTDAHGRTIEYSHDIEGRQETIKDRLGHLRVLYYDDRGNVVTEIDAAGNVIERTFDARNNRLSETLPHEPGVVDPPRSLFTYDSRDNLLTSRDPAGNLTIYTYNARNQVLTKKDPNGNLTTNVYDANGNLLETHDALGGVQKLTYDARGNVLTQLDFEGGLTRFEYDGSGNLVKETDALGNLATFTYDANGNRLTETRSRTFQGSVETLVTTHTYDGSSRLLSTRYPDGTESRSTYDALGNTTTARDELGRVTIYEYDALGRLVKTTYPDTTFEEYTYDAEGRRLTSTDRGGRVTTFEYDALGRVTRTEFEDGSFSLNEYDAAGLLSASTDANGNRTRYEYDAASRRTKAIDALEQETVFTYDANGNQLTVTDARGKTTEFRYDALNRKIETIFPDASSMLTEHDSLGRRILERDQAGRETRFEYDALGRLTKVVDALLQETSYSYDEVGNRIHQTDANGHLTTFEHDRRGRETKRTLPGGSFETMVYDAAGRLSTRTDFNGALTSFAYDAADRLLERSYPDGTDVRFTYTANGRRETATDERGDVTNYVYDSRDRLTALTDPEGRTLSFGYDGQGNRTSQTAQVGARTLTASFAYDELNRLTTATDPLGRVHGHGYDEVGNRALLTHPDGSSTAYQYDDLNRLRQLATTHPAAGTIQSYGFTLGPSGNRERIDEAGGTVREYAYDALYRLTGETVSNASSLVYQKAFVYDPVGNRLSQVTAGAGAASIAYTYDSRDRLTSEGSRAYGWDANGNLLTKDGEAAYSWDYENRLIGVVMADGTVVEHAYDADGNRVRTEVTPATGPPGATELLVDSSAPLSQVVAEIDSAGNLTSYYFRGIDLLSVMRPTGPSTWSTRYYHADGVGSIRKLTDESGNVTDSYTYTAFGELLEHTGSDPQPYAFTGEPLDPNTGFQYHRARWLDPRTGRFASADPFSGGMFDPLTLHKYLYAANDPLNGVDPTGLFGIATLSVGLSVMNIINAISLPSFSAIISSVKPVTLYVRSFAPWRTFGGGFSGDNRTFTTRRDRSVTSRITGIVQFRFPPLAILSRVAYSDPSHHSVLGTATGIPTISTTTAGATINVKTAGALPLIPGAPDIDVKLDMSIRPSRGQTCYAGQLSGDAFPNAEVFLVSRTSTATMLHTYATTGGPATGPLRFLPGDNSRPMGSFSKCLAE
jgi:RHS repeat-associated protein